MLSVYLRTGAEPIEVTASLDTGAAFCIFERRVAELLGIDLESGYKIGITTVTGRFTASGHFLNLSVLGLEFETVVYFAEDSSMRRNVLGRIGWLDKLGVAIVHYDGHLYLSDYDSLQLRER